MSYWKVYDWDIVIKLYNKVEMIVYINIRLKICCFIAVRKKYNRYENLKIWNKRVDIYNDVIVCVGNIKELE